MIYFFVESRSLESTNGREPALSSYAAEEIMDNSKISNSLGGEILITELFLRMKFMLA